ncbi:MAG TPA: alpha/beta hydrolase [Solirubrobacteraceae bacterium]|nr:alpha/beta hydrolase [Solirubrobacteraceae bacterium]
MRPSVGALLTALVAALLLTACGGGTPSSSTTHARHPAAAARRIDGCLSLGPGARRVVLRPQGGEPVDAVLIGRASTVFVLSDESDENLCSWLPFVAELRARGYGALLYDYLDPSQLPADAAAGARAALAAGARRAVLMGASVGARASIEAAASRPPGVSAVIALSAEQSVRSDPTDLTGPARRDRIPALLVAARQDPYVERFTPVLLRALGSRDKRALILPGLDHGTALLTDRNGSRVRAAIFAFVSAAARSTRTISSVGLPQPGQRCGPPDEPALTLRFRARDGVPLAGAIVGHGPLGVVLLHEYPGPMCGWWPYAVYLAGHGVQALLFDFRCAGLSSCPPRGRSDPVADVAGAMRALRSRGARSIALVGASLGGVVAVIAGGQLNPAAIVDLSGERDLTGLLPGPRLNSYAAAAQLHVPALFAVARDDRYVSVADMRAIYDRARSRVKHLVVLPPGSGHGWDLLQTIGGTWTRLAPALLAFIGAHEQ